MTGGLAVLAVTSLTSHIFVILFLSVLEEELYIATNQLMILQLRNKGVKAVSANSQNMLFRYESAHLELSFLNHEGYL